LMLPEQSTLPHELAPGTGVGDGVGVGVETGPGPVEDPPPPPPPQPATAAAAAAPPVTTNVRRVDKTTPSAGILCCPFDWGEDQKVEGRVGGQ